MAEGKVTAMSVLSRPQGLKLDWEIRSPPQIAKERNDLKGKKTLYKEPLLLKEGNKMNFGVCWARDLKVPSVKELREDAD